MQTNSADSRESQIGDCYVCGRALNKANPVYLEDDDHRIVYVGPDCYERVVRSGHYGMRSGKGRGPLVFVERRFAEAYALRAKASQP